MRIAAHDPDLAITALLKTRFQTDNNTLSRGGWNPQAEANLEMNIAGLIVGKDPAAALKLARSNLARGVSGM
jgi:hypothetical protein